MTLHLHAAERTDALADGLADLLVTPLPDPFAREVVVVPARGVERWLTSGCRTASAWVRVAATASARASTS